MVLIKRYVGVEIGSRLDCRRGRGREYTKTLIGTHTEVNAASFQWLWQECYHPIVNGALNIARNSFFLEIYPPTQNRWWIPDIPRNAYREYFAVLWVGRGGGISPGRRTVRKQLAFMD